MNRSLWITGLVWVIMATPCLTQAQEIPPANRIEATVLKYLTGSADQPLVMPTDIAIDSQDRMYVLDGVNDRVVRFTPDGNLDRIMVPPDEAKLHQPLGLTVDSQDQLWIADTGNHRLVVLSDEANLVATIELPSNDQEQRTKPTDIALTPDDRRTYVVDNINHRLLILENDSGAWTSMGKKGWALGQFDYPFMICVGIENYVYISEAMGARVQRISPSDLWSGYIGSWGIELGKFYRPKGLAADAVGQIYVNDSTMKVIQVFGPWGRIKGVLTDAQGKPIRFEHPMGMSFDSQGRLLVVEMEANRVAILSIALVENGLLAEPQTGEKLYENKFK